MAPRFSDTADGACPLHVIPKDGLDDWLASQTDQTRTWVAANGFTGALGQILMLPDADGRAAAILAGYGDQGKRARLRFPLAAAVQKLPEGSYHLADIPPGFDAETEALGWLLSQYSFDTYRKTKPGGRRDLVAPEGLNAARIEALAAAEYLTRDLINTPAADMGPDGLEAAARDLADTFGAEITVTRGAELLDQNYPMIHAVGRTAGEAPRLIDIRHGQTGPQITLVGKGVCFDTGGLNLKPGGSMGLMKKDMGGAATVLGLTHMILALALPVRLRVLVPAVENAIGGGAFRPQDILHSRKGLTVEINNTDAEGRLVLADALALADEDRPDLIVSMATLTGAARVAVGPDLAPFYTDADAVADALKDAAASSADPVWQMPFHTPYDAMIEPGIADLDNAPTGGFAGSITAALFLRRFVTDTPSYLHFDIYGWQPSAEPGRSKGGFGQGARATLGAIERLFSL